MKKRIGAPISAGLKLSFAAVLLAISGGGFAEEAAKPLYPQYPSETPDKFTPVTDSYEYDLRDVMIPMRDGVKLHTIILVPKGTTHEAMLLTRTPYEAKELIGHTHSGHQARCYRATTMPLT